MIESIDKSRREFIKTCFRFGVGGGLVFAGIILGTRERKGNEESDQCQLKSPCHGCGQYSGCDLPKALAAREETSMKGGNRGR